METEHTDWRSAAFHSVTPRMLAAAADSWPRSPSTPVPVAEELERARRAFVLADLNFDQLEQAVASAFKAVELMLRQLLDDDGHATFAGLLKRAHDQRLISDAWCSRLDAGRQLRNHMTHSGPVGMSPGMADSALIASHTWICEAAELMT